MISKYIHVDAPTLDRSWFEHFTDHHDTRANVEPGRFDVGIEKHLARFMLVARDMVSLCSIVMDCPIDDTRLELNQSS